ncbi:hypothetical protein HAX54_046023 [Datura stramonium]|uniref:Uncharacterized protein n=1 Tax=Datura stramonium TaxID=4076 RepID=A0ABS8WI86_DATST|nr:hypothetical protein [Datura stramonium]
MAPKSSKRKGCLHNKPRSKRERMVQEALMRILECHNNHQGDMDYVGSWRKKLNVDYQLSEHSRALYRVGPGLEEPFDNDDPTNDEKARVDSNLKYDVDDGDDSEMGEVAYALIDEED